MYPQQKHPVKGVSIGGLLVQLVADQREITIAHAVYLANPQVVGVLAKIRHGKWRLFGLREQSFQAKHPQLHL